MTKSNVYDIIDKTVLSKKRKDELKESVSKLYDKADLHEAYLWGQSDCGEFGSIIGLQEKFPELNNSN